MEFATGASDLVGDGFEISVRGYGKSAISEGVRFPFAPGEGRAHFQLCRPDSPRWHATPPPQGAMVDLGANGRQSDRQRPIGEVDRANQNRFAPSRQMPLVYPWQWLCVRSVLPGQVFLAALVATDIRERLRGVCPRLLCKDRRRLAQCSAPVRPYFPICTVPDIIPTQAHQAGSAPPYSGKQLPSPP